MEKFTLFLGNVLVFFAISASAQVDVLTQHTDLNRTGFNDQETLLNIKNVKAGSFAKLFSCVIDDKVYAQPLVVSGVSIPGEGMRNVVYVATVNNTVYAFDADSARVTGAYWHANLTPVGMRPPRNTDISPPFCRGNYRDFLGNMGIVGTPVIDKAGGTIYLVTRSITTDGTNVFAQYLHALDIRTGAEKAGSPVTITAQVNGTGDGSAGGVIQFDPMKQNQRPGLLLLNGIVYIGYSSHCDWDPYHGWLLGYDATTLQQKIVYNTTPGGSEGGIWMSGSAPSADASGNIFLSTGNGTVGVTGNPADPTNRGEGVVKLTPSGSTLAVSSFFTPYNYASLDAADLDFGSVQVMLIPNTQMAVTGSKEGKIYLLDRDNMGGYLPTSNNVLQSIDLGSSAHMRTSLTYYKGTSHEFVYTWPENTLLRAFPVDRTAGNLDVTGTVMSGIQGPTGNSGAVMSTSSNGAVDSTGILWVSHANQCDANQSQCPGILRAINANDVSQELWNSNLAANDNVGNYAKFVCPTIANGKVYLPNNSNRLLVYGLTGNPAADSSNPAVTCAAPGGFSTANQSNGSVVLKWTAVSNASGYIVQYRNVSVSNWTVINSNTDSVVLPALSCGYDYLYQVASTCTDGQQSAYSAPGGFSTPSCPSSCSPLPTRWSSTDIGNIGVAGAACYSTQYLTYNIKGSGGDIGGNADAFRFAYMTVVGDNQIVARIVSQDASDPGNKAGIMARESNSSDAPNAFIGITHGQGAVFQYRNNAGESTIVSTVPGVAAPYWVKLAKNGSNYSGYISPDGFSWTKVGSTMDLGFGANSSAAFAGLAVTSHDNAVLSAVSVDNVSQAMSVPLPVTLTSFTGRNVHDQYVALQWTTASEENTDHFEVEKCLDGIHFKTVLTVKAAGNSRIPQQYMADDLSPASGMNFYRLRQVDVDGNYAYSPVILVRVGSKSIEPLIFPNPVDGAFNIAAGLDPVKEVNLYDVSGKRLGRVMNESGASALLIPCGNLAPGVYIVEIRTATKQYFKKLIKR